jgi:hypothetical protein
MSEIFFKMRIKEMLEGKMKRYLIFGFVEIYQQTLRQIDNLINLIDLEISEK